MNLLFNRKGQLLDYQLGSLETDLITGIRRRRSKKRLAGLRVLVVSSRGRIAERSELVLQYRLDNISYLNLETEAAKVAWPQVEEGRLIGVTEEDFKLNELFYFDYLDYISKLESELSQVETYQVQQGKERAILVGSSQDSLDELTNLTITAGVDLATKITTTSGRTDPTYYIRQGKLAQLKQELLAKQANVVIFDDELTPAQHSNLEEALEVKVIDRAQLILDIFARHANTKEGKLQVELAQLEYLLPRLTGRGAEMSRLGGGIGTRGSGETKLEIDRRRIRKRIHRLKDNLKKVKKNRQLRRENRRHPVVSLVGYTNAGKSTLMNLLTEANVEAQDKLFATLDSTLRQIELPIGRRVIVSDTVGFIKKLPHHLVAAFKATLEEIEEAELLLHIVDSSHPNLEERIKVVHGVLEDLGVLDKDIITVFNKSDLVADSKLELLQRDYPNSIVMSAVTGEGKEELLDKVSSFFAEEMEKVNLKLPYQAANWLDKIYQEGRVLEKEYDNQGIEVKAQIPKKLVARLKEYQKS
ncbi:GTPase HflX [Halanaerocella petrolearia]